MNVQSKLTIVPVQPVNAIKEKYNVTADLIPFEAEFDYDIADIDLLSALCGIEDKNLNFTMWLQLY